MVFAKKCVYFSSLLVFGLVSATIKLNVVYGRNTSDVTVAHAGITEKPVEAEETKLIGIQENELEEHMEVHVGEKPTNVYFESLMQKDDLYKVRVYHWEQVKRILKVKSSIIEGISYKPVVVHFEDFENAIKVHTGIKYDTETSATTSWTKSRSTQNTKTIQILLQLLLVVSMLLLNR